MKKLLLAFVLCVLPIAAFAHPGKTDKFGGHECLKGCEDWKLYYKEYHLHDKDGKPIRISKKPKIQKKSRVNSAPAESILPVLTDAPQTIQTLTVYQYVTHTDTRWPFNPLLLVLLVLLLLLLIFRVNRKQTEDPRR